MADVFISYSRKDKAFVQVLHQALAESKYDAWIDWQDIPPTADWWAEIEAGIEAADAFLFMISADSVASKVCNREIDHAVANHKRLIPIVRREDFGREQLHLALSKHNWLYFREKDEFETAFAQLVDALNTDVTHVRTHTGLLVRALEWEKKQRTDDLLLRGKELDAAEQWLQQSLNAGTEPAPTEHHKNYIHQSRDAANANRRARRLVSIGGMVLAAGLIIAGSIGWVAQRRLQQANLKLKSAELEQTSLDALQQFNFQEIEALLTAMKAGQDLSLLIDQRSASADYPAHGAVVSSLQQILNEIRAKHVFQTKTDYPTSSAYSPDGQLIAISSVDSSKATLMDLQGNVVAELSGHGAKVWDIKFSPNGNLIATASADGTAKLWDLKGKELQTFAGHRDEVTELAFSSDGKNLITASGDGTAKIWDLQGRVLRTLVGHEDVVWGIGVSPDGKSIATTSNDGTVILWDFDGSKKRQFRVDLDEVWDVKFSPDGKSLATASNSITDDSVGKLWDLEGNQLAEFRGHSGGVLAIDFSPDGKTIVTASTDKTARLWDLEGNQLAILTGHQGLVRDAKFSPNGEELVTLSWNGTAHIWSLFQQGHNTLEGHQSTVLDVDISQDGQLIATASDDTTIRLWNPKGQLIRELNLPQAVRSVDFSPDGKEIAAGLANGYVQIWSVEGRLIQEFVVSNNIVEDVNFSPDGKLLAVLGLANSAQLRTSDGKTLQTLQGHQGFIHQVVFSPTAPVVATVSDDGTAKLWSFQGEELQTLQQPKEALTLNTLDFSPDGQTIAAASIKGEVFIWDANGKFQFSYQAHIGSITQLRFSPDGQRLVTASEDGKARLWDLRGRKLGEFTGHEGWVRSVDFAPDGEFIVTAADDRTARIWKVESLDQLLVRGCDWLNDYLVKTPLELIKLDVCQTEARLAAAAPALVSQGEATAKSGNYKSAIAIFKTALAWNPELTLDPKTRADQFQLIGEGETQAQAGDFEDAINTFKAAVALDESIDLNPEEKAREISALSLMEKGNEMMVAGAYEEAIASFTKAQDIDSEFVTPANTWNQLCWNGSLQGYAQQVLDACNQAVEGAPDNGGVIDSRGLARALTGDIEGAIADFQYFVEWTDDTEARSQRQQWIEALKADENPFTPEVLEILQ